LTYPWVPAYNMRTSRLRRSAVSTTTIICRAARQWTTVFIVSGLPPICPCTRLWPMTYYNRPISKIKQLYLRLFLDIPPSSTHVWHIDHCRMVHGAWLRSVNNRRWPVAERYMPISAIGGGAPVVSKAPSTPEPKVVKPTPSVSFNKNRCCDMPAVVVIGPPMLRQTSYLLRFCERTRRCHWERPVFGVRSSMLGLSATKIIEGKIIVVEKEWSYL